VQNPGRALAPPRTQTFFSLGELRDAIALLLAALTERPHEATAGSRDLDRPVAPHPPRGQ
jgi:hypothetical protein